MPKLQIRGLVRCESTGLRMVFDRQAVESKKVKKFSKNGLNMY